MKAIWDIAVYTALRNDGKWVAATDSSPYFYLEADSEHSVLEAAKLALFTYRDALPILQG
jgi:predicted RNase H-like HicB family nuclease